MSMTGCRYITNGKTSITIHFDTEEERRAAHPRVRSLFEAPADEWIKWDGGECPVPPSTEIMWRTAGGGVGGGAAGNFDWSRRKAPRGLIAAPTPHNIVAYKVVR